MGTKVTAAALAAVAAAAVAACGSTSASGHSAGSASSSSSGSGGGSSSSGYGYSGGYSGGSSTSAAATSARGATVHVAHTSAGSLLVNGSGFTLYLFTADRKGTDHCVKVTGCTGIWPPLTVSGNPTAGKGAQRGLLGTIRLPNGRRQVTYAGHPLYRYSADSGPAATSYLGFSSFGGTWEGVSPTGHGIK